MLYSGLYSMFGVEVVDYQPLSYLRKGGETKHLYGRGFTLYGLLEDGAIDRTDIPAKIRAKFFDYVIFGSIQREYGLLGMVRASYPANRILLIDGEDGPLYVGAVVKQGIYFKRELHSPKDYVYPIEFAIPEEKILGPLDKSQLMAPLDPLDTSTYIYDDEKSYYQQYQTALFGKTMKKAGWDCLRHYEIMACGAIPYFMNLEWCPATIMTNLPKQDLLVAKSLLEYDPALFEKPHGRELWMDILDRIMGILRQKLTTTALAKYVLDVALKMA